MASRSFTVRGVLREGWELTKVNLGFLVVYQIILFFLGVLFFGSDLQSNTASLALNVIGLLLISLGKLGLIHSALMLTRGLKPSFDQFYKNWPRFIPWLIASFLFGLACTFGFFLFIIPGLLLLTLFGFFPFFILDKKSGPIDSLKQSEFATRGFRWEILLLFLSCLLLNILGLLFFGVGLLLSQPVSLIALAVVYLKITKQEASSIQPEDI